MKRLLSVSYAFMMTSREAASANPLQQCLVCSKRKLHKVRRFAPRPSFLYSARPHPTLEASPLVCDIQKVDVQFQTKPNILPLGIPSIRISSPLIELCNGPQGELEDGRTTVVSQYGGTASRRAAWYDC